MRVRRKGEKEPCGWSSEFNTSSISEIIVQFDDGDADSDYMKNYEVYLSRYGWMGIGHALNKGLLTTDDYNTRFYEYVPPLEPNIAILHPDVAKDLGYIEDKNE